MKPLLLWVLVAGLTLVWVSPATVALAKGPITVATNAATEPPDLLEHHALEIQPGHWVIATITTLLVMVCVLIHYEVLKVLSRFLAHLHQLHRTRVLVLIWGLLITHLFEIWIYGIAYFLVDGHSDFGQLHGIQPHALLDHIYFSFVTYTTVGYGDIVPVGPIRFLAALEALSGWVLLGWSTSFTFLEMQRFWRETIR